MNQERQDSAYKYLALITPEHAQEPVFVSPFVSSHTCKECGVDYSRLIYHKDKETKSQHFHKDRGGIYFYEGIDLELAMSPAPWIGIFKPQGEIIQSNNSGRSEVGIVTKIRACCNSSECEHRYPKPITQGKIVFEWNDPKGILIPRCEDTPQQDSRPAQYHFKIENESISFLRQET